MKKKKTMLLSNLMKEQNEDDEEEDNQKEDDKDLVIPNAPKPDDLEDSDVEDTDIDFSKETPDQYQKGQFAGLKDTESNMQFKVGHDLQKDVYIRSVVLTFAKPWVVEIMVNFNMRPTQQYKSSHTDSQTYKDKQGKEFEKAGHFHYETFIRDIEKRFGRIAIYNAVNTILGKMENKTKQDASDMGKYKFLTQSAGLEWDSPAVVFLDEKSPRHLFRRGEEVRNTKIGYYLRFVIPDIKLRKGSKFTKIVKQKGKDVEQDMAPPIPLNSKEGVNSFMAYKIELLKKEISELGNFKSDENFLITPEKSSLTEKNELL